MPSASAIKTRAESGAVWPTKPVQVPRAHLQLVGEHGGTEYFTHPQYGELRATEWVTEQIVATYPGALPPGPVLVEIRPGDNAQMFMPLEAVPAGTFERLAHPEPAPVPTWKAGKPSPGVRSTITTARPRIANWVRDIDELDRLLAEQGIEVRATRDPRYVAGYGPGGRIVNDAAEAIDKAAPLYLARFAGVPLRCVIGDHGDNPPPAAWLAVGGAPVCRECLS